jgi:hypothetical protein
MGNHYHLLVKTKEANLSEAMQWLGLTYSGYYNFRHSRTGHLFQGRFKSFIVEELSYLKQLILYVHRNPIRAKMVRRLLDYRWSSFQCLGYGRHCQPWLAATDVLKLFEGNREIFRDEVRAYSSEEASLFEDLREGVFLGGEKAFQKLKDKLTSAPNPEQPQIARLMNTASIADIESKFQFLLKLTDDELEALRRPRRKNRRPFRDVLILLCWQRTTSKLTDLGRHFNVGYSSISHARKRGEADLRTDRGLRKRLRSLIEESDS